MYVMHKQEHRGGAPHTLCHEAEFVLAVRPFDELVLSEQPEPKVGDYLGTARWCIFWAPLICSTPSPRA